MKTFLLEFALITALIGLADLSYQKPMDTTPLTITVQDPKFLALIERCQKLTGLTREQLAATIFETGVDIFIEYEHREILEVFIKMDAIIKKRRSNPDN